MGTYTSQNRITNRRKSVTLGKLAVIFMLSCFARLSTYSQGTLTADWPWVDGGISYAIAWREAGLVLWVIPQPPLLRDGIAHVGAWTPGYPTNATPKLAFQRREGNPDYVAFARTNNAAFGLVSVDLADPVAPSPAPIEIVFNGFKGDGSIVSQSFIVGGVGSSSFQTFYFGPDFAHGLVRVEIPSPAWAMDNLVWVPEPRTYALLGLGLLGLAWHRFHKRRKL